MTLNNTDNGYLVTVRNRQTIDNETNTIDEMAYGNYYEKNGKQYIIYKTENNEDKTSCMIKKDKDSITIKRSGSITSAMIYKIGLKQSFMYHLPYGDIEMEIETEKIASNLSADGGTIQLVYTLTVQDEEYYNDMNITVVKR